MPLGFKILLHIFPVHTSVVNAHINEHVPARAPSQEISLKNSNDISEKWLPSLFFVKF